MRCALDQARSMPRAEAFAKDDEFDDGSVAGCAEPCMFAPGLVAFLRSRFIRPPALSDRRAPIYAARWAGGPLNWVCRTCRRGQFCPGGRSVALNCERFVEPSPQQPSVLARGTWRCKGATLSRVVPPPPPPGPDRASSARRSSATGSLPSFLCGPCRSVPFVLVLRAHRPLSVSCPSPRTPRRRGPFPPRR